ncbi:translation elongation factor Ts [Janthinobacterium sp. B9-8]|uniref:translation elongation factor Ts n=1 Tax=Janthinobacterium sp. B9-8 TaxID=1236179 RepID=UPI00061D27CB|nr:translation elongation factor Ts [Janthinobacterium sp. B9-8]AMC34162.1 elongation factor Ts [Janthinobacterium sp. B9-8]
MAEITAKMVAQLRELTGLGMMECKKALVEADGDIKKAEEVMRIKSGNKASKLAGRTAAEGIIAAFISDDKKIGAVLEVNCETDFLAKDEGFIAFAKLAAQAVADANPADVDALSQVVVNGKTVEEIRKDAVAKLGENVTLRRFARYETAGQVAAYLHGNKLGVLLDIVGGDEQLGKQIAMHIAATKPKSLDASGVPAELIETERRVATERAKEAGKPEAMLEKIVEGTVQKYLKDVVLLSQPFVMDDKVTIEQLLKTNAATVNAFNLFVVGEGIEKAVVDYAAEVAAAAKI